MYNKDPQFVKRVKSLAWRAVMMGLAFGVSFAVDNLSTLQLSPTVTTLLGLILGEVSKYINSKS